jgi:hypothetical protein
MAFLDLDRFTTMRSLRAENVAGEMTRAGTVGLSTFGFAYANGAFAAPGKDHHEVAGAPTDLVSAVVLHGLAFVGLLGKYSEHAHNVGTGALAAYLARLGTQLGVDARARRLSTQKTSGPQYMGARQPHFGGAWRGVPAWATPR